MKVLQILSVLSISFLSIFCSMKSGDINYNSVVKFSKGEQLKFPDFTLEYTGERTEKKEFPNGNSLTFTFHDFSLTNGSVKKTVSWSSGTGDIGPMQFDFEGRNFEIEMSYSEKLKTKLDKNELVIVRK
jgi:hypothetical protein